MFRKIIITIITLASALTGTGQQAIGNNTQQSTINSVAGQPSEAGNNLFEKIIIGLISIIIGAILYHLLTNRRNRIERQIKAGETLITAFDETIKAISSYDGHFYLLENILLREFEGQKIAAREFRRHLGIINRSRFNKAWKKYYDGNEDKPTFRQYMMTDDIQGALLSRIDEILKFAK